MRVFKEFELRGKGDWRALVEYVKYAAPLCKSHKRVLRAFITDDDKLRSKEQNARYWAVILPAIADQAVISGRKYQKDVWHEYFAGKFLPKSEIEMPDLSIKTIRASTTKLRSSDFANYCEQVQAEAAQNFGVVFER